SYHTSAFIRCPVLLVGKEDGDAYQQQHDEREGGTVVPHSVVNILLHRGAEQFDVVHCQQLGNGKGRNRRHKHHHYAAHHSRHGERQNHLAEYAGRRGSQVLRSLNQIVVHLLKGVVNGVYHERQEVVDHTEHKGTFAQRQVQE